MNSLRILIVGLILILILISGCSTVSSSVQVANSQFCLNKGVVTGELPLQYVTESRLNEYFMLPLEPGTYRIEATTSTPELAIDVKISYREVVNKDKFGNPLYQNKEVTLGTVNRYKNLATTATIPQGSIEAKVKIYESLYESKGEGCGTLKVFKL